MTTITPEVLAELERLEKAADSQPWEHDCDDEKPEGVISHADTFGGIGIMWNHPHGNYRTVLATGEEFSHANARLIVGARNHLPALIAAARERDRLVERGVCGCGDVMPPCVRCRPITDPELERLSLLEGFEHLRKQRAKLKADLLTTRRALRLAQARAMHNLANTKAADALTGYFTPARCFRAARLATHWAKKFERMAADCGEEIG